MTDVRTQLKFHMAKYIVIDNALHQANVRAQELRKERKVAEDEMCQILQSSDLENINTLKNDEGCTLKIQRPGSWNKGWTLSKKELDGYLASYFMTTTNPTAKGCFDFIVEENKKTLVSTEFSISRTI